HNYQNCCRHISHQHVIQTHAHVSLHDSTQEATSLTTTHHKTDTLKNINKRLTHEADISILPQVGYASLENRSDICFLFGIYIPKDYLDIPLKNSIKGTLGLSISDFDQALEE
ncbi:hypothetical protein ACJX0J_025408, partial [Zea mays]